MAFRMEDGGEPPRFVKWLIWLFRKDTWKEHPFIAIVATIIAASVACSALYTVYTLILDPIRIKSPEYPVSKKIVVLMDSTLPEVVYDPETRSSGGTNADDITEVIDDLQIKIVKENTSLAWQRDEQVLQLNPNLIIIHLSAFYDQTNVLDTDRRLTTFLRFMARSRAQFILYTRAPSLENQAAHVQMIRRYEAQIPELKNRLQLMFVPGGPSATFRNPDTARKLKLIVKETLDL